MPAVDRSQAIDFVVKNHIQARADMVYLSAFIV